MEQFNRTVRRPIVGAGAIGAAPLVGLLALLEAFTPDPEPVENTTVLIDAGAEVDARDDRGNTPLHHGAWAAAPAERIRALVAAGADPTAVNAAGETPLDLVPDDSALWGVLIPLQTPGLAEASVPGPVRNLRVTEFTDQPETGFSLRRRTYDLTWDRPASDGGSPITVSRYQWTPCDSPFRREGGVFRTTRARAGDRSFAHTGSEVPVLESSQPAAAVWAINAKGSGPCVDVPAVSR